MLSLVAILALQTPCSADLQAILDKAVTGTKLPGMTAAVALPDGRVIECSAGLADKEAGIKMRPDHRMPAGSIGKTWVAAVALQMVEQKKLDLDAKVGSYLKAAWFSRIPNSADITVRHLLQHTSGIPEHVQSPDFTKAIVASPDKVWSPEELLRFTLDQKPLFEAGKGWSYADTNFCLLGAVIEAITGKPLFDLVRSDVLTKTSLESTEPQKGRNIKGLAQGYTVIEGLFGLKGPVLASGRMPFDPQLEYGGGGMISTSGDLARWAVSLYTGKVVSLAMTAEMTNGVPAKTGPNDKYGLGCQIRNSASGATWGHSGWFPGWLSDVQYWPKQKIAIAVQCNTDDQRASGRPFRAIIAEIAEKFVGPAQ